MNRHQEIVASMEAEMKLNQEAEEKTIITIKDQMQVIDEKIDSLIEQKQALTKLLWQIEGDLERLK